MQASTAAAAVTNLLRPLQLPAIGVHWVEQGGIFAGLVRGQSGAPDYALIVASEPAAAFDAIAWGEYGKQIEGADSYFDGQANTQAMAAAGSELAQRIGGLIVAGFNDWYLPAQAELQLCRANVTELFQTDEWYWSSTQYSPYGAWAQGFEYGSSNIYGKYGERRVLSPSAGSPFNPSVLLTVMHAATASSELVDCLIAGRLTEAAQARTKVQADGHPVPVLCLDLVTDPAGVPVHVQQPFPAGAFEQCERAARRLKKGMHVTVQAPVRGWKLFASGVTHIHTNKNDETEP